MKKVLFVCLGNICRSPLAEGLFHQKVQERNKDNNFKIDSCGTSDYHIGETPDERTMKNALKNGLKLNHRGRQFSTDDFKKFDHILAMDRSNYEFILSQSKTTEQRKKVQLIRDYETDNEQRGTDVPDPYYGGPEGFQNVFNILNRCTENLLNKLEETSDK